jgi:hypothetical protein
MQFVVETAVDPGNPDQSEDHAALAQAAPVEVPGEVAGGLRDQHDDDEVVEELQWADNALARLFAIGARRLPQKATHPPPERPLPGPDGVVVRHLSATPCATPLRLVSPSPRTVGG